MTAAYYQIRLCPICGLRYPLTENHPFGTRCPSCLGETHTLSEYALAASGLPAEEPLAELKAISALLDNIRSAWNVGSIFRTADGLGISKLYLCGITPTPANASISKTALGAERSVPWEYSNNAVAMAKKLKLAGCTLIALEQDSRAKPLHTLNQIPFQNALFIAGNEITGVDPSLLDLCDHILHIPMHGQKRSLNVEVAFGIAAYQLISGRIKN